MRDGDFFGATNINLQQTSQDLFGGTGIILGAIALLTLALMGVASAIDVIIFKIAGLIVIGLLNFLETGSAVGMGSTIIWAVVAGGILIFKISKRRIQ